MAGISTIPVKIGTNSHTRMMKNPTDSRLSAASTRVSAYSTSSTGMVLRKAAVTTSASNPSSFTRGSSRCSSPGAALLSSLNITCRSRSVPPVSVFCT